MDDDYECMYVNSIYYMHQRVHDQQKKVIVSNPFLYCIYLFTWVNNVYRWASVPNKDILYCTVFLQECAIH